MALCDAEHVAVKSKRFERGKRALRTQLNVSTRDCSSGASIKNRDRLFVGSRLGHMQRASLAHPESNQTCSHSAQAPRILPIEGRPVNKPAWRRVSPGSGRCFVSVKLIDPVLTLTPAVCQRVGMSFDVAVEAVNAIEPLLDLGLKLVELIDDFGKAIGLTP